MRARQKIFVSRPDFIFCARAIHKRGLSHVLLVNPSWWISPHRASVAIVIVVVGSWLFVAGVDCPAGRPKRIARAPAARNVQAVGRTSCKWSPRRGAGDNTDACAGRPAPIGRGCAAGRLERRWPAPASSPWTNTSPRSPRRCSASSSACGARSARPCPGLRKRSRTASRPTDCTVAPSSISPGGRSTTRFVDADRDVPPVLTNGVVDDWAGVQQHRIPRRAGRTIRYVVARHDPRSDRTPLGRSTAEDCGRAATAIGGEAVH